MDGEDYARARMATRPRRAGNVKFFNSQKGFGFINDRRGEELGGQEVFCHYSAIAGKGGFRSLAEGEEVEYEIVQGPKGFQATNLTGPGGRNVVGDPKARLAQPPPYLPFSSMSMPMSPPYGMGDPYLQRGGYPASPYTQHVLYGGQQSNGPPGGFAQYASQPQGMPHQQGSLGLQSPMMGQGIGLGAPSMMGGMNSPIGAFYGGGGATSFGGIGSGMGSAREAQSQYDNLAQAGRTSFQPPPQNRDTSSSSHYFGPLSPPGGHHTALGPAPTNSFGIFGNPNDAPPSALGFSSLSNHREEVPAGVVSTSYGSSGAGSNGYLNGAGGASAGSVSGAVGAPRGADSRSGTPRGDTPGLGNGTIFGSASAVSPPAAATNGTGHPVVPPRDLRLGFEGLSIESQ